jgi:hypothetical protein
MEDHPDRSSAVAKPVKLDRLKNLPSEVGGLFTICAAFSKTILSNLNIPAI